MNGDRQKEHLNWLHAALAAQRSNVSHFLLRLKGIASRVGENLSLNKKFMRLMDQVAADRDKELDIINKIEALEKRHHQLKKLNLLRRADLEAERRRKILLRKKSEEYREDGEEEEESPHRLSILELFLFYYWFSSRSGSDSGLFSLFGLFSKSTPLSGEPTPEIESEKQKLTIK
jgi:hypothetical protein